MSGPSALGVLRVACLFLIGSLVVSVMGQQCDLDSSSVFYDFPTADMNVADPSKYTTAGGDVTVSGSTLALIDRPKEDNAFGVAVWHKEKARISSGFKASASVLMNSDSNLGFTFTIQNNAAAARGGGGANLGMSFSKSISVFVGPDGSGRSRVAIYSCFSESNAISNACLLNSRTVSNSVISGSNSKNTQPVLLEVVYNSITRVLSTFITSYTSTGFNSRLKQNGASFSFTPAQMDEVFPEGTAWFGITSSTPESSGATGTKVYVHGLTMRTVAMSASRSRDSKGSSSSGNTEIAITAGANNVDVANTRRTFQLYDACDNIVLANSFEVSHAVVTTKATSFGATGSASIKRNSDASYALAFSQTKAGSYDLEILVNSAVSQTYKITINPDVPSVLQSKAEGLPADLTFTAGVAVPMTVTLLDRFKNIYVGASPFPVRARFGCCGDVEPTSVDTTKGLVTFNIGSTVAAASTSLEFKVGGTSVSNSPFTITVLPGPATGANTFIGGSGLAGATVGSRATITITMHDQYSNPITSESAATLPVVSYESRDGSGAMENDVPAGDQLTWVQNRYEYVYSTKKAGQFSFKCSVNGVECYNSASSIATIQPGPVVGEKTVITSITSEPRAGSTVTFTLDSRDSFDNFRRRENPADTPFMVKLKVDDEDAVTSCASSATPVQPSFAQTFDCSFHPASGLYRVRFIPTKVSNLNGVSYEVSVTSPLSDGATAPAATVTVKPGAASPEHSLFANDDASEVAGKPVTMEMRVFDRFDNPATPPNTIALIYSSDITSQMPEDSNTQVSGNVWTRDVSFLTATNYVVTGRIDGRGVKSRNVVITHGPVNLQKCSVPESLNALEAEEKTVVFLSRDSYDNAAAAVFECELRAAGSTTVLPDTLCAVEEGTPLGSYVVKYTAPGPNTDFSLFMQTGGNGHVVASGRTFANEKQYGIIVNSDGEAQTSFNLVAGVPTTFYLQNLDENGDPVADAVSWSALVYGSDGAIFHNGVQHVISSPVPEHPGRVTFILTGGLADSFKLKILTNAVETVASENGGGYDVTTVVGLMSGRYSTVSIDDPPALNIFTAGAEIPIIVTPYDSAGNPVVTAETITASARRVSEDGTDEDHSVVLEFGNDHLYRGVFRSKIAGDYSFVVTTPGQETLPQVPFTVAFASISPKSYFDENPTEGCIIGASCDVSFFARDEFENAMHTVDAKTLALQVKVGDNITTVSFRLEPTSAMLNTEGSYILSFVPTLLGEQSNTITLFAGSEEIGTKTIEVGYARSIGIEFTTVDGIQNLAEPGRVSVEVVTRDAYGNPWAGTSDAYEISMVDVSTSVTTVIPSDDITFAEDQRSFTINTDIRTAATYAWVMTISDVAFGSSAAEPTFPKNSDGESRYVSFKVNPGAAYGPNTIVSRPGSLEITASNTVSFTITARDKYGNVLESEDPTAIFAVFVYEGRFGCNAQTNLPEEVSGTSQLANSFFSAVDGNDFINYDANGSYKVTMKTNRANRFEADGSRSRYFYYVTHNNLLVRDCASLDDAFRYVPGALSGSHSVLSGVNFDAVEAGSNVQLQIAYADEFGNEIRFADEASEADLPFVERFDPTGCDGTALSSDITVEVGPTQATLTFSPTKAVPMFSGIKVGVDEASAAPVLLDSSECIPFKVHHSHPHKWEAKSGTKLESGVDTHVTIESYDVYDNLVDLTVTDASNGVNDFSYKVTFLLTSSPVSFGSSDVVYTQRTETDPASANSTDLSAPLAVLWPGTYEVTIEISEPTPRRRDFPSFTSTVVVSVGVCSQKDPATPFQCRDFSCVAGPSDCPEFDATCPFKCVVQKPTSGGDVNEVYECVDDVSKCECPVSDKVCQIGEFRFCARATSTCPTGLFPSVTSPSQRHCNPGYVLCPDRITCAESEDKCIVHNGCPAGQMICPTGQCVNNGDECPSLISCPSSKPILCQDNSCAASTDECSSVRPCLNPRTMRCPDGSCATEASQCPVSVVCPSGSVLCETGFCASSPDACPAASVCAENLIRCPDGSCVADQAFCPTRVSCAANTFLCPDGSTCVRSVFECPVKPACPADRPVLCPSGACAASMAQCSTAQTCPSDAPVRCADNSCVSVLSRCAGRGTTQCPDTAPVRCGDGTCHRSIESCSSLIQCPVHRPLKCPDSKCVSNPADCGADSLFTCPSGQVKCHSGMCAPNLNSCPTVVSCQPDQFRCPDGTCRKECTARSVDPPTCAAGLIQCPLAEAGIHCATSLAACPQGFACPRATPIRCTDMSCASHVSECSKPDTDFIPNTRVPCGGGSWASQHPLCGAPVTCPASQPAKCWDESCRRLPEDCPPMRRCPFDFPFLCSDGSCQLNVWSCATARCTDPTRPLRCPAFSASRGCVAKLSDCLDVEDLNANVLVKCPAGQRCWDGSCASELRLCPPRRCPVNQPFLCRNGACAANEKRCPHTNGCPWDRPVFCAASGTCVADAGSCGSKSCTDGLTLCADGTCRAADECLGVAAFGCPKNAVVCHDKSCAAEPAAGTQNVLGCIDTGDKFNACPASRPFRCPGGFCAVSSTRCPVLSGDATSPCRVDADGKPLQIRCDDGSCAYSFAQCPIVKPCDEGYYRCGDGTCKQLPCDPRRASCRDDASSPFLKEPHHGAKCSDANTCPSDRPYRCQDGLCAATADDCIDNYPVVLQSCCAENLPYTRPTASRPFGSCGSTPVAAASCAAKRNSDAKSGCPETYSRCANGICLPPGSSISCTDYTKAATIAGCPAASPFKCPDGACVASESQCRSANGCPASAPVLCAGGSCAATVDACSSLPTDCELGQVRCSNGHCSASLEQCLVPDVNCPLSAPIRCANGDCKKYPALFGATHQEDRCPPTLACTGTTPFLCGDGTCAPNSVSCRPVFPCASGVRCPVTGVCAETMDECSSELTQCPAAMPIMCPNGACARSSLDCLSIGESPRRVTCPASAPIRCFDGSCANSPAVCVATAVAMNNATDAASWSASTDAIPVDACPNEGFVCPNGMCVPTAAECAPVPACASGLARCSDGTCSDACPAPVDCEAGSVRCEDGTCRANRACPVFDGCPSHLPFACYAEAVQCVKTASDCNTISANTTSSAFSTLAFFDFSVLESDEIEGQEVCASNCERQIPATAQTVVASPSTDTSIHVSTNSRGLPRMSLSVPGGSFRADTKVVVHPVPSSLIDLPSSRSYSLPYSFNLAPTVKGPKPGVFASKVVSTPFHCTHTNAATGETVEPSTPLAVTSFVDITTFDGSSGGGSSSDPAVFSCELQGNWDAAILGDAPNVVDVKVLASARARVRHAHAVRGGLFKALDSTCAGAVSVTGNDIKITMEPCGEQYSLAGEYVSTTQLSPWSGELSQQKVIFSVTTGDAENPETKNICVFVQRVSDLLYMAFPAAYGEDGATAADLATCVSSASGKVITAVFEPNTDPDAVDPCSRSALITNQIPKKDICLAKYNSSGLWDCIYNRDGRIANPVWYEGMAHTEVTSAIPTCTGVNAYAFVHEPLPDAPKIEESHCGWWCKYGLIVIIVLCVVAGLIIIAIIFGIKVYRDRVAYKKEQARVNELKERAKDLNEYAGGLGLADADGEVIMVANPLVLQLQELQKELDTTNATLEATAREEEFAIQRLEMQRQRIREEMRRVDGEMKKQEASGAGPRPQRVEAASAPQRALPPQSAALSGPMPSPSPSEPLNSLPTSSSAAVLSAPQMAPAPAAAPAMADAPMQPKRREL